MAEEDNKNDFFSKYMVYILVGIIVLLCLAFLFFTAEPGDLGNAILSLNFGNANSMGSYNLKNAFEIVK